jgi:hypothetical protein
VSSKADAIRAELEQCKDVRGRILPRLIVKRARNKKSALHSKFEWSDAKAADQQRLERARELIGLYLTVVVVHRNRRIVSPMYVSDTRAQPGHVLIGDLTKDNAVATVQAEIARCDGSLTRARGVATQLDQKYPGLLKYLDTALRALGGAEKLVAAA